MRGKILLGAAAVLLLGLTSSAQVINLSLSSGVHFPKEKIYRDIYGRSTPLALEIRVGISRSFGLAAGIEYLSASGAALNINQGDLDFPLRFRMISYPLSGYFLVSLGQGISLRGAAGISFHSYREEWEDVDLLHEGSTAKPFVSAGIEYAIVPRLAVHLWLRYESIVTEWGPYIQREVNLGGLSLLGGLIFQVF
ncbi:MAG: hypothetical protein WBC70_05750 [Candidatus Aminicenantales bacterium]